MAVSLHSTHFRFGINELAESTHGWHAALDTNPVEGVIAVDTTFLLRFTVQETGGTAAGNTDQQFQCRLNGGTWQNITTTSSIVKAVTTTVFANGADLTKRLSGTGTFESSGDGGTHDGLSGGAQNDIAASGNSETECALQIVGADVVGSDVVEFRLTSPDFTITNDVVPAVTIQAAAGFTLTAENGSVTATGVTAEIRAVRRLTGAGGTHSVTGQVASLLTARRLSAEASVYAWAGSAADLRFGYRLLASDGAYEMTGVSATLLALHPPLLGEAGSYAVAGVAARATLDRFPSGGGGGMLIVND